VSITSRRSNTVELTLDSAASGAVKHPRARLRAVSRNDLKGGLSGRRGDGLDVAGQRVAGHVSGRGRRCRAIGRRFSPPPCETDRNRGYFNP